MKLHECIQVTAELVGRPLSDAAISAMASKLASYPPEDVRSALDRCAAECRTLRLVDVLERLPHGHPGAEEAWAICAPALTSEEVTIVWTDEMAAAFFAVRGLAGDNVAARMAFRETYQRARGESGGSRPRWWASLGHDSGMRDAALRRGTELGRLTAGYVKRLAPLEANRSAAEDLVAKIGKLPGWTP